MHTFQLIQTVKFNSCLKSVLKFLCKEILQIALTANYHTVAHVYVEKKNSPLTWTVICILKDKIEVFQTEMLFMLGEQKSTVFT